MALINHASAGIILDAAVAAGCDTPAVYMSSCTPDTGESVSHEIQQFLLFGIAGNVGQGDADDVFGSLFQMIAAGTCG